MSEIRMATAGESHGPYEVCLVEGIPAGLELDAGYIDLQLARRQRGYGRGGRMDIEVDRCELAAGVRLGMTMGSPIALLVANKDHANWSAAMRPDATGNGSNEADGRSAVPRPGHADFAGMAKFGHTELRPVLERASARETVARVAGGSVCRRLLDEFDVTIKARVVSIGEVSCAGGTGDYADPASVDWESVELSTVGCEDAETGSAMCVAIDAAREAGESLGGVFEVWAWGVCPGLGSHATRESRLDGRLLGSVGSIPAIKGVEIASAFENARLRGSQVHDPFVPVRDADWKGVGRGGNRAGGLEGGMTNGMPLVLRAAMKPIPTLVKALASVDLQSLDECAAHFERSDVTAVPAARVVGEAMVAYELARAYAEKFGGDSMVEMKRNYLAYVAELEERGLWRRS